MSKFMSGVAGAALLAGLAQSAFAQDLADEILIIGSLTPISASELGSSVTVLDAKEFAIQQNMFAGDLLRQVNGLHVNQVGPIGARTQVRIRGAEGNHTLTLIDGIEVGDPSLDGEFGLNTLTMNGLSRVTVLRGGQSGLYGSDALGGVISYETFNPFGPHKLILAGEAGSFGTARGELAFSAANDVIGFSGMLSRLESDGENALDVGSEKDGKSNTTGHINFAAKLTETITANVVYRKVEDTSQIDRDFTDFPAPTFTPVAPNGNDGGNVIYEADYVLAALNYQSADGKWFGRVATQSMTGESNFDASFFQLEGKRRKHELLIARDFELADASHRVAYSYQRETESAFNNFGASDEFNQKSHVLEYRVVTGFGLAGGASVRHDNNDSYQDVTTWRAQAAYQVPGLPIMLHTSAGEGIKAPTFAEAKGGAFAVANPDLKPETATSYDFGATLNTTMFDRDVNFDVTVFRADLEDRIFTNGFLVPAQNDTGTSRRDGLEVNGAAQLNDFVVFSGGFSWVDARTAAGAREIYRPVHSGFANIAYVHEEKGLTANLNLTYNGDMRDLSGLVIEDYTLVNAAVSYALYRNVDLTLRGSNLFDEQYEEAFGFNSDVRFVGSGRGLFVGIRASLGD